MTSVSQVTESAEGAVLMMPHIPKTLDYVGDALQDRFHRTGSTEDLDHAIAIYEWAVSAAIAAV